MIYVFDFYWWFDVNFSDYCWYFYWFITKNNWFLMLFFLKDILLGFWFVAFELLLLLLLLAVFYPLDIGLSHIFPVLCHLVPVKSGCSFDVIMPSLLWSAGASFLPPRSPSCYFSAPVVFISGNMSGPVPFKTAYRSIDLWCIFNLFKIFFVRTHVSHP